VIYLRALLLYTFSTYAIHAALIHSMYNNVQQPNSCQRMPTQPLPPYLSNPTLYSNPTYTQFNPL